MAERFKVSVLKAGVRLYHRFESCRILLLSIWLINFVAYRIPYKRQNIMVVTFFALRPMFAAADRLGVDKAAFLAGLSLSYFSRKTRLTHTSPFYNAFGITTTIANFEAVQRFSLTHSFVLMATLLDGRLTLLDFAKSVHSFSLLSFYPVSFFRLNVRLLILPLLGLLGATLSNIKSRSWLL